MMNEQEFEEFKQNVREARKNRLYVNWRNSEGSDCRTIGPSSQCFCGHRYKEHNFDDVKNKKIHCRAPKCACKMFTYIPIFGSQDLKCLCKHSCKDHHPNTRKCLKPGCKNCHSGFTSKHGCSCPDVFDNHETVFETREEREMSGRPVDPKWMQEQNVTISIDKLNIFQMTAGMGGLTQGFMDLVEGQDKQDFQNPAAIMSNLQGGNMLMGSQMKAIGSSGSGVGSRGQKAIGNGNSLQNVGQQIMQSNSQSILNTQNAFALFSTPHQFGQVGQIKKQLKNLKMR
ncbi:UNKNOWN [Stylonychia lemnae]|uniref:Protein FAM221A n=1 Tax=Stylonychia lemnae TaxID=5949 RepID=A0A078AS80_STYLE|nr:UNKNOWN [Stylonychia lemnae]|eukprot:CDW85039.1 UNKNOWN [Stylonychia lemnae]